MVGKLVNHVESLVLGFKELKNAVSNLENNASGLSGVSDPVYQYRKHLPNLNHGDFPGLPYWHKAAWGEICNGGKAVVKGDNPILTLFFKDATGDIAPKSEIQAARNLARSYFELLWTHKRAPPKWSDAPLDLQVDFIRTMEEDFGFLRFCDRHWKSEQIFMNYYPTWYSGKTGTKKKTSKRARPADDDGNDGDNDHWGQKPVFQVGTLQIH